MQVPTTQISTDRTTGSRSVTRDSATRDSATRGSATHKSATAAGARGTGRFLALAALGMLALAACEEATGADNRAGTYYASAVALGNGTARAYVTRNEQGEAVSLGVEMSESALSGLGSEMRMLRLPLPKEAANTGYTFMMLDWNPQGHAPDHVYTVPHFDFHFYMEDEAVVGRIAGGPDPVVPEAKYVPADYISPGNESVPGMGVHWIDRTAGELNGRPFDQTFLYGYTGGRLIFVEPMITRAFLETRPDFSMPLKQPQAVQRPGLYPARYSIRYDAGERVYRISIDELARR